MKNVFVIESQGRTALFAPIKGLILEIKDAEKERIVQLINQPQFSLDDIISFFPEIDCSRLFQKEPEKQNIEKKDEFYPTSVVLFPTLDCNLRCIYCYSDAGEQKANMTWQIAEAAIDFVIDNAKLKGHKEPCLEFHGGGEPTWNWSIFQMALDYFQQKALQNDLTPKVNLATNGMLSTKQIEWIVSHIDSVQISLDGMEEIQNFQRPTAKGGKSFAIVYNTVRSLLAKKIQVIIHCVITDKGIGVIPEIIQFLMGNFPGVTVHLEPVCESGRGLRMGQKFPSPELFVRGFIKAEKIADSFGGEISYSGAGPKLAEFHQGFCGVSSPNFVITPTALVSACHEVAVKTHPLAKYFIYGHLDQQNRKFVFDYEKIRNLRGYNTETNSICEGCFAKYYCAGDCLVKRLSSDGERKMPFLNPRCKINQELTKHHVFKKLFTRKEDGYENSGT